MDFIELTKQPPHEFTPVIGMDEYGSTFRLIRIEGNDINNINWISTFTMKPVKIIVVKWKYDKESCLGNVL